MIKDAANPINGKPMRVMSLTRDVELGLSGFYDEVDPIPLTAEILEKNGFKHSMPHNDCTNADCNFYLYEGGNGYCIQNTDIKLDYVHQLQHLFRLCNIEKEIII